MIFREYANHGEDRNLQVQLDLHEVDGIARVEFTFAPTALATVLQREKADQVHDLNEDVLRGWCLGPAEADARTAELDQRWPGCIEIIHFSGATDLGSIALGYPEARLHVPQDAETSRFYNPMISRVAFGVRVLPYACYDTGPAVVELISTTLIETILEPPALVGA